MHTFRFNELKDAPLIVDAIYKSGAGQNIKEEPLHILLPRTSNQGGFRITHRQDNMKFPAYVVIYTTLGELEWPDFLDAETGIFRYYGDNRLPGKDLHDTRKKGNQLLQQVFEWLNSKGRLHQIPPFLIFKKAGEARDVQFLGLAAPGSISIPPDRDLISFWRTMNDQRFQNYEAYFTILDLKEETVSKKWLESLVYDYENSLNYAPKCWKSFINFGREGIHPLRAPKISVIPSKKEQLPADADGRKALEKLRNYYKDDPYSFEKCAVRLLQMMDSNFYEFELTRPWRDGGRDAIGKYRIGTSSDPLTIDCAVEAKCYSEKNAIGVKQMSRLISRIRYRQFGVLVTTSCVDSQAYKEVKEDGHPILIIHAKDIAEILRKNGITHQSIEDWLKEIDY